MDTPEEVTQLLIDWSRNDRAALDRLVKAVYKELHQLAEKQLRQERPDHTLQATALVHEAFIKLVDLRKIDWKCRAQFFALAAQIMRNILVDYARSHMAAKRGGGIIKLPLNEALRLTNQDDVALVALDDALTSLEVIDHRQKKIVEMRYFGGLSVEEIAEVLDVSPTTVRRDWRIARAWLLREITGKNDS